MPMSGIRENRRLRLSASRSAIVCQRGMAKTRGKRRNARKEKEGSERMDSLSNGILAQERSMF